MKKLFWLVLVSYLAACSTQPIQQPVSKTVNFEQAFAEQCIKKEIKNSINKDIDRQRFSKPCSCIAKRITNNLSKREKDKFLLEHKITHALTMSFDRAAYFCVQNVTRPKAKIQYGQKRY